MVTIAQQNFVVVVPTTEIQDSRNNWEGGILGNVVDIWQQLKLLGSVTTRKNPISDKNLSLIL